MNNQRLSQRQREKKGKSSVILGLCLFLVTLAVLLVVAIAGIEYWLTRDQQVFLWAGPALTVLCTTLGIILKSYAGDEK